MECENCGNITDKKNEVDAKNYHKRLKIEKTDKIFVCDRCANDFNERSSCINKIIKEGTDKDVIVAGAGTGKTYTFREYIHKFNKDDPIYIATFINNLVDDLKKELKQELEERNIKINTFHKFCYHLLQLLGKNYFYLGSLTDLIIEDAAIIEDKLIDKNKLKKYLNYYKANIDVKYYFERGNYYNAVGNDNICFALLKVLKDRCGIDLKEKYKQIIIDEYQDFNFTESSIIKIISENNKILIAGDDDQTLYTFKDSHPKYIRELWGDPKFSKFTLPFCNRCPEVIVDSFNHFILKIKELGLLQDRIPRDYKCYFPDKYSDSRKYSKIFWHRTSIRKANTKSVENILINDISKYVADREIEAGKLNFLIICPDSRNIIFKKIKENVINELNNSGLTIVDHKKKKEENYLSIEIGYSLLKKNKDSNLGWRIIINKDPLQGWENLIKDSKNKNIAELLPEDYKIKHLKLSNELKDKEPVAEDSCEEGINILFTNLYGPKGLSADHVFILFPQDGIFPQDPSNIEEDEVYKFLVAITRSKKSLKFITTYPHSSKFISMLPKENIV